MAEPADPAKERVEKLWSELCERSPELAAEIAAGLEPIPCEGPGCRWCKMEGRPNG